jgi:hypothetical protein
LFLFPHLQKHEARGGYQSKTRGVATSLKGGVETTSRGGKEVFEIQRAIAMFHKEQQPCWRGIEAPLGRRDVKEE